MDKILINNLNSTYFRKKDLKYRIPSDANLDEVWETILEERKKSSIKIPFKDQSSKNFWFNLTPDIDEYISKITDIAKDEIFNYVPLEVKGSVMLESLIDEAYNSSVIEGAFSTKKRAEELVKSNSEPRDNSEQMILNNYRALKYVVENIDNALDEKMLLNIYEILTYKTLREDDKVEKYRNDFVGVWDQLSNKYSYEAVPHEKVQGLMDELISFINENNEFNPLIKACIIHFYFVYIHPFFDGNGRTARTISYMYLLQQGYDFFKFFSISSMIKEERRKYYEALEDTEIYDSDMTYFMKYYLTMIKKSMDNVIGKFNVEYGKKIVKDLLEKVEITLSLRQFKMVNNMISSEKNFVTVEEYKNKHKVSYETSRTDLNQLTLLGFFKKKKVGKKYIYHFNDISTIIKMFESY